jgi:hypothetical protein
MCSAIARKIATDSADLAQWLGHRPPEHYRAYAFHLTRSADPHRPPHTGDGSGSPFPYQVLHRARWAVVQTNVTAVTGRNDQKYFMY